MGGDNVVQMNLVRRKGSSSRVVIRWKASGEHNGIYDINPVEGMVSAVNTRLCHGGGCVVAVYPPV